MKVCGWRPLHTAEKARPPVRAIFGTLVAILLVAIFGASFAQLYTEHLWFREVGFTRVFWTRNLAALGVRAIAAAISAIIIYINLALVRRLGPISLRRRYGNLEIAEQVPRHHVALGSLVIAVLGGWWLATLQFGPGVPLNAWAWLHHASWGTVDPLFHRDLSFYVFTLPILLISIDHVLLTLFWSAVLVMIGYMLVGAVRTAQMRPPGPQAVHGQQPPRPPQSRPEIDRSALNHFAALASAFLCVLALRFVAGRYTLAVNGTGVHGGIGYTDVHARVLGQWVLAWLAVIAAVGILYGSRKSLIAPAVSGLALFLVGGVIFGAAYPALVQNIRVAPNQLARETPYIEWNLAFTRQAFGLSDLTRTHVPFTTATPATWNAAAPTLQHLALWDVDQLSDAFQQVQSFQGYYTFTDVDFDRYQIGSDTQQVGIGVREFTEGGLPAGSRNWFNLHRRPEFTRGVGAAIARTNTAVGGAPDYLVGEIAPIRVAPDVASDMTLTDPSVYFGELSNEYVIIGADSAHHAPKAGVAINSLLRVLAFAWRFGDHNLLFTPDLDTNSRLLFHRLVRERVQEVAPFLSWDQDALPVVADGHVQWVLDGYTTASSYPMSAIRSVPDIGDVNYMRGSVKATVDAVTGAIHLYATDAGDPILRTYSAMFPGLIRSRAEMPAWLRAHLRYPASLLAVQADILEQYHVQQPNAFYAGQDAWDIPVPGAIRGTPSPNEPLYLMMQMQGAAEPQYVATMPFTARARHNLTAVLVAQNSDVDYGKLTLLDVTGDEQIKGPAQIQSLIEQDAQISQQLSLWRQLGTAVKLGQLRILPTTNSILYVEPLFLAAEDKAIPQLNRVLVSDGANVAMAETLDGAIAALDVKSGLSEEAADNAANAINAGATRANANGANANGANANGTNPNGANAGNPNANLGNANANANGQRPAAMAAWPKEALRLYDQAEAQLRAGDFAGFGVSWQKLRVILQKADAEQRHP